MGQKDVLGKARRIKLGKRTNEKKFASAFVLNPDEVRRHQRNSDLELHLSGLIFKSQFLIVLPPHLSKHW